VDQQRPGGKFWEPIKALRKKRAPQAVTLTKRQGEPGDVTIRQSAAALYAEFLEQEHWGRALHDEGDEDKEWPSERTVQGQIAVDEGAITGQELDEAIAAAKHGRAPGLDGIPAEAWKAFEGGRISVLRLFNKCLARGAIPDDWRKALVVGMFEAWGRQEPGKLQAHQPTVHGIETAGQDCGGKTSERA